MTNFFDKYELYTQGQSIYCYANSSVLKNKLNIQDIKKLTEVEAEMAFVQLLELEVNPIKGNFDKNHLYSIHKFLFEDIYYFAGETRKEDISKGSTSFCVWNFIDEQLDDLFEKSKNMQTQPKTKDDVTDFLTFVMAELNIIHPFREGNGRTIREFVREYALKFGYKLQWNNVSKTDLLDAMIESVVDTAQLSQCLKKCIVD